MNAHANPSDPSVQAGDVNFQSSGNTLNIFQSSDKAIIDWRSFNIGSNEHTQFHQPGSGSFTLNRVRGDGPSNIDGSLTANGRIAIINQNGVYFGGGAQVDVGSLIVSTADISNDDFMNGNYNFGIAGNADAKIINAGHITARDAGLVGLVAPQVENHGVIAAELGQIVLAAGDTMTLDFAGDGLIQVSVADDLPLRHHVSSNTGTLRADGGRVMMTAAAARDAVDNLVVNTGVIEARSIGTRNGKIVLGAPGSNNNQKTGNSTVLNHGRLDASGTQEGETGGSVELYADHVGLMAGSEIDVTGDVGGGTVLVGGDYQGAGDQTAIRTYVDADAFIRADALTDGHGGRVIVWADDTNRYYGSITARGGENSGNGGFIEVSGKNWLDFAGAVDLSASNGDVGTLLLDPTDIVISNAADANISGSSPFQSVTAGVTSNLNVTTLQNALATANVTVQTIAAGAQSGNITVSDSIVWSANQTLTLSAHNKVIINASITARNSLTITAADIDINASLIEQASGASLVLQTNAAGTTIGLAGGAGAFNLSAADLNFIQNGWNAITVGRTDGTGAIDVGARTWNAPLTLRSTTGEIKINGAQNMGANALTITTRNLSINNTIAGTGTLSIAPDTNITVGLAGAAGTLNLTAAELDFLQDGFSSIVIGRSNSTSALTANAYSWRDALTLQTGNANLTISGAQTMLAGNNLTLAARNVVLNDSLIGTGTLSIRPDTNASVGIMGGAGTFQFTQAMLNQIGSNWGLLSIGLSSNNQAMTVNTATWLHNMQFLSGAGVITIAGNQNLGSRNLTLRSDSDMAINANLSGSGTLTISQISDSTTLGLAGGAGTVNINSTELGRITDGWSQLVFGHNTNDAAVTINAHTWNDSVLFRGDNSVITIAGEQNLGANNLTIRSDGNPVISAALTGTGTLTFETDDVATTIGLAGGAGTYNLSAAELAFITDGWSQVVVGRTDGTGNMTVNAASWSDDLLLQTLSSSITIAGAQTMGSNNLNIHTNNLAINSTLSGSGNLTIRQQNTSTTLGLAGGAGTLNLTTTELNNISNGWSNIILGRSDSAAAVNINGHTWSDHVRINGGSGLMTIAGAQNLGANNFTLESDNLNITSAISGTGVLTIRGANQNTSMGLAGGSGTLNLTVSELNNLSNGWSELIFGRADGTGAITVNAYSNWNDAVHFLKNGSDLTNSIVVAGAQTATASSNASFTFDGNTTLQAGVSSDDGAIDFLGKVLLTANTTLDRGSGAVSFSDTLDGAHNLTIQGTGSIAFQGDVGAVTRLGDLSIGNAAVSSSGALRVANYVQSGGTAAFNGAGLDASGDVNISAASVSGVLKSVSGMNFLTALSLANNVTLDNGAGAVNFAGTVNGAHNLTIQGTGSIAFQGDVGAVTRLGDLSIGNAAVSSSGALRVANYVQSGGTAAFNGAGLDASGDVDIQGQGITGALQGVNGNLGSGAGTILASVSFDTLNISGAGATLSPGYIGLPGSPSQAMANLISINGVLLPSPNASFTFANYVIGFVPSLPTGPVIPNNINVANVTNGAVSNSSNQQGNPSNIPRTPTFYSGTISTGYTNSNFVSLIDSMLFMDRDLFNTYVVNDTAEVLDRERSNT